MLLANSTLDLARENLKNFSNVVDVNRERVRAGDLAESEFFKISLQKLQFEQDVSAAEIGARCRRKARCGRTSGYESLTDDFEVDGDLAYHEIYRHARRSEARRARGAAGLLRGAEQRDARAAHAGAGARQPPARHYRRPGVRPRRLAERDRVHACRSTCRSTTGTRATSRAPRSASRRRLNCRSSPAARSLTDVVNAYAALQTSEKVLALYRVRLSGSGEAVARHHHLRVSAGQRHPARSPRRRAHVSDDPAGVPAGAGGVHDERSANQSRGRKAGHCHEKARSSRSSVTLAASACRQRAAGGAALGGRQAAAAAPTGRRRRRRPRRRRHLLHGAGRSAAAHQDRAGAARRPGPPKCARPAPSTGTTTTPRRRSPRSAARSRASSPTPARR